MENKALNELKDVIVEETKKNDKIANIINDYCNNNLIKEIDNSFSIIRLFYENGDKNIIVVILSETEIKIKIKNIQKSWKSKKYTDVNNAAKMIKKLIKEITG
jgi:hypothetical protein